MRKMKSAMAAVFAAVMLASVAFSVVPVLAATSNDLSNDFRFIYADGDDTTITGWRGTMPSVLEIPDGTTKIGENAFGGAPMTKLIILGTITDLIDSVPA